MMTTKRKNRWISRFGRSEIDGVRCFGKRLGQRVLGVEEQIKLSLRFIVSSSFPRYIVAILKPLIVKMQGIQDVIQVITLGALQ